MTFVGFDIGNDTSVVAVAKNQAVHVLLNNDSNYETPSVVSFAQKKRQIGSQAASLALRNPEATISQIKRIIGKRYIWPGVVDELRQLPFLTSEGPDGGILICVDHAGQDRKFAPVQILAMLFSNLRKMVETNPGISSSDFVIGVPSYFTDSDRIAYLDAAQIAGMDRSRVQLMHEGTATALGYGFYKNEVENGSIIVVFVDVGHCATQVTVVEFNVGRMRVLSHASDRNVGGREFDRVLFDYFRKKFRDEHKIDIVARKNWRACARLMTACEKVKKVLTSNSETSISIDCLVDDLDVSGFITRKDFEVMSTELLFRVVETCVKALTVKGIDVRSVHSVELTGSGSRIPAVSQYLSQHFGQKICRTLNGSECVARGCALQCVLTNHPTSTHYKVEDVFPFTVGYIAQPSNQLLLLRGQPFPHSVEYMFNLKDSFHLDIYQIGQDESPNTSNTRSFEVDPYQVPENQHLPAVKVHISLTHDGIVIVYASLIQRMPFNNDSEWWLVSDISGCGMQQDALLKATYEENGLTCRDREIDDIQEKRNALEAYVYDTQKKFAERYRNFSNDLEKRSILKMLEEIESWLYEDSDDISKNIYSEKLCKLKELLRPIENRYRNSEDNDQAARVFQCHIDNIKKEASSLTANQINECAGFVESLAYRSINSNLGIDTSFDELTTEEPSDLSCDDDRSQTNFGRYESQHHQTPRVDMQMRNSSSVPSSPGSRCAVNNSVKPATLNQEKTCQDFNGEEFRKKEALDACITEVHTKFLEWFGGFATESEKDDLSTKMKQIMCEVNQEYMNHAHIDYFRRVEELQSIVKSNRELYLDEEANAAAVCDLLYSIFQYRVQVISSKDMVMCNTVHNKCRDTEEWLQDRMMLQDKESENSNRVLRFREIVDKMEELEALYQKSALQNEAPQDCHADLQIMQSTLSDKDVTIADIEENNAHVEDALTLSIPEEVKVPNTEGNMDVNVADRRKKEEEDQGETSNSQTSPLESDASHHDEIDNDKRVLPTALSFNTAEAKISKNDDQFSDADSTAHLPHAPDQQTEISGDETREEVSVTCDMEVD